MEAAEIAHRPASMAFEGEEALLRADGKGLMSSCFVSLPWEKKQCLSLCLLKSRAGDQGLCAGHLFGK